MNKKIVVLIFILFVFCIAGYGAYKFTEEKEIKPQPFTISGYFVFPWAYKNRIVFINCVADYHYLNHLSTMAGENFNTRQYFLSPYAFIQLCEVYNDSITTLALIEDPFAIAPMMYDDLLIWTDILPSENGTANKIYSSEINGTERRLIMEKEYSDHNGGLYTRDIWGNKVLIEEECTFSSEDPKGQKYIYSLYICDLTNSTLKKIDESPLPHYGRIYEDEVIYESKSEENMSLWLYDVKNGESSVIKTAKNITAYDIYNEIIVYIVHENGFYEVCCYDRKENKEILLSTDESYKSGLSLWNDKIVWLELRDGDNCIVLYNLITSEERILYEGELIGPLQISDNLVVWQEGYPGNPKVKYVDLLELV